MKGRFFVGPVFLGLGVVYGGPHVTGTKRMREKEDEEGRNKGSRDRRYEDAIRVIVVLAVKKEIHAVILLQKTF